MSVYNVVLLALCVCGAGASSAALGANPIRKVVTLMQNMQAEVEAELKKEEELFEKFMCFCKGGTAETAKAIEDGKAKIDELAAKQKSEEATKSQLEQEVIDHKTDRESAKADLAEATSLRQKEKSEFDALAADAKTNIAGLASAIPAIEKGMGGANFLQLPFAKRVIHIVQSFADMDVVDRRTVMAFLQNGEESEGSGEILGIMKQMKETMEANLKDATDQENTAAAGFAELEASKKKEIEVATEAIETKTLRSGELAVAVVQTKDALEDETEGVAENEKMAEQLGKQCATKAKSYDTLKKEKTDEIAAISDAIGILNDDDALDVFKKAMPSSAALVQHGMAFLQKSVHSASKAVKAQALLETLAQKNVPHKQELHLMLYTMKSKLKLADKHRHKTQKFDEIIKAVDEMVGVLGKEQDEDDKQKAFCQDEFDKADDEKKVAEDNVAKISAEIDEATDSIGILTEEIKALSESIAALDKSVVVATAQRKEEHEESTAAAQMSQAAIELVGKAKKRLEKFYGGAFVQTKAVPDNNSFISFAQVRAHARMRDEADEDDSDSDDQQSKKEGGVIAMMDGIIHDLEMDMKDSENEEKSAAEDYAKLMADSQETRTQDSKSISDKMAAKADGEDKLVDAKDAGAKADEALLLVKKQIADLHASCDFLIQNYAMRKDARAAEVDALKNAKAMLQGAVM